MSKIFILLSEVQETNLRENIWRLKIVKGQQEEEYKSIRISDLHTSIFDSWERKPKLLEDQMMEIKRHTTVL